MKIALIGEGAQGHTYAKAMASVPGLEVVSVAGGSPADVTAFAQQYGIAHHGLSVEDATKKLGVVTTSTRTDLDFTIERHADGSLWFLPARVGATMALYSTSPVAELTSIDRAPSTGFTSSTIQAVPGFAYVFRLQKTDGVHFAGARVAFITTDYVVFDWSYQNAPGNPELSKVPLP